MTLAGTLIIAMTLPFWVLQAILFAAFYLIVIACLLAIADAFIKAPGRRNPK
jgi:hypothetical protein